jgi:hypothetical protein
MQSSGILRRVTLVRTDIWEECSAFTIKVTRITELATTLAVTSNRRTLRRNTLCSIIVRVSSHRALVVVIAKVPSSPILVTLMTEALYFSETSVLTRATRRDIPEVASRQVSYTFNLLFM